MAVDGKELSVLVKQTKIEKIVLIVGSTGTGKSTILNMLYNDEFTASACCTPCAIGETADSVTKKAQWLINPKFGNVYGDTVGFSDPGYSDLELALNLKRFIQSVRAGVHCIIIVTKYGRLSREERSTLQLISEIFQPNWATNCIMVATHYDGEYDDLPEGTSCTPSVNATLGWCSTAINKWVGPNDPEFRNFIDKIGKRVILTDNSLGRHEEANRPLRKHCLMTLRSFIRENCKDLVSPAPINFSEKLIALLEKLFMSYRMRKAMDRVKMVVQYVESNSVNTGECTICTESILLSESTQTECNHTFHMKCLKEWLAKESSCPICRASVKHLYTVVLKT